ncbi:MAG TPA: hypothetical protein VN923_20065, partial [Thermoanaerobaculia bacterium]|nr:hypothetical protein [Thermoanaerobaculia bacterium]
MAAPLTSRLLSSLAVAVLLSLPPAPAAAAAAKPTNTRADEHTFTGSAQVVSVDVPVNVVDRDGRPIRG